MASAFLLWYASSMPPTKRKVSVSLDEDLVGELEREEEGLSAQISTAVRAELERRRRNRLLTELLAELDASTDRWRTPWSRGMAVSSHEPLRRHPG
jgi:hypothetical protein